jgi:hypothetical protein
MELPHAQLLAPLPPIRDREHLDPQSRTVAVRGDEGLLRAVAALPNLESLWASGVGSTAAKSIGRMTNLRRLVVHDLRASDFTPLTTLTCLESLAVAGSSKIGSLDGLEGLATLRELILFDCSSYSSVEPLRALMSMETLCLEGGFSKMLRIASLAPLSGLHRLVRLRLASLRVEDGLLRPLRELTNLRSVFIAKTFDPDELRSLAAALPEARGEFLDSYRSRS